MKRKWQQLELAIMRKFDSYAEYKAFIEALYIETITKLTKGNRASNEKLH